jgi:penicillin-binding protein 1A
MNRVVGGSLPAEIWREIMLGAHAGKPPLPLPGAEPTGADVAAEPVYPQERIADDFIARALGGGAGDTGSIDQLMAR